MIETPALLMARRLSIAVPALLLGGAYMLEYGFGLYPCEMCMWQRSPHFIALGLGLLAAFVPLQAGPKRMLVTLAALSIIISGLIGGFHAGVEYKWWQGVTGCATTMSTGGSALDNIMNAPSGSMRCSPWELLGISLAGWNFLISIAAGVSILFLLWRRKSR